RRGGGPGTPPSTTVPGRVNRHAWVGVARQSRRATPEAGLPATRGGNTPRGERWPEGVRVGRRAGRAGEMGGRGGGSGKRRSAPAGPPGGRGGRRPRRRRPPPRRGPPRPAPP